MEMTRTQCNAPWFPLAQQYINIGPEFTSSMIPKMISEPIMGNDWIYINFKMKVEVGEK